MLVEGKGSYSCCSIGRGLMGTNWALVSLVVGRRKGDWALTPAFILSGIVFKESYGCVYRVTSVTARVN